MFLDAFRKFKGVYIQLDEPRGGRGEQIVSGVPGHVLKKDALFIPVMYRAYTVPLTYLLHGAESFLRS